MATRTRMKKKMQDSAAEWTTSESLDLYGIERWSDGLFTVNPEGQLVLQAERDRPAVDVKELVDELRMRGLRPPVLLRFNDILRRRIEGIAEAFENAFATEGYQGHYRPVYPIKVNQHRHVVEDVLTHGRSCHMGLECGSKAELAIGASLVDDPEALIIYNGFKDQQSVELALSASRLGRRIFLVVEKAFELPIILERARALKVEPLIGIRMKLATRGRGPWEASGGDRSKFGLTAGEIVDAVRLLRRRKMLHRLQLLHSHIGSQVTDILRIREALREAATIHAELHRLGAPIQFLDIGGGLAVDYDGSHTNFESSANYSVKEYAADVVAEVRAACDAAGVPHPTLITEAGRALVAHHAVLVVEALAASHGPVDEIVDTKKPGPRQPEVLRRMHEVVSDFSGKNFQETYHDAVQARREALQLFSLRHLSLEHRAEIERLFRIICSRIHAYASGLDYIPDDLAGLERLLATTYYCNFSLFQSLPDHWAIKQLFPVVPLHRHTEKPSRAGVLADITCDSDGIIDRFVDLRDVRDTLPLHPLKEGEPYDIGIFLVGAYQEILGDLHNLYGDTHVVHVSSGPKGYTIDKTVEGQRIEDVLSSVAYTREEILRRFRERVESALQRGDLALDQSAELVRTVDKTLEQYTYLQLPDSPGGRTRN